MRTMQARYAGRCRVCNGSIDVGDMIQWARGQGARHADYAVCEDEFGYRAEQEAERRMESFMDARYAGVSTEEWFENEDYDRGRRRSYAGYSGFGHDPEVPAGFQDADIEMSELEREAEAEMRWEGEMIAREEEMAERVSLASFVRGGR